MKLKKLILIFIILILSLSIASVSASDISEDGVIITQQDNLNLANGLDNPLNVTLETTNFTMYYHDGSGVKAILKDQNGTPLANQKVYLTIGKTYEKITDANGTAFLRINLNPGNYTVDINYENLSTKSFVQVLPPIKCSDLTLFYKNGSAFEATFLENGVPLKEGSTVQFNIVGKTYSKVTDANGTARLNINLGPGNYVITAIHPEGFTKSCNILVKPSIISSDLEMVYKDGSAFEATFLDKTGVPLENTTVQFSIIGKTYSKITDEKGVARLNINLGPGSYVITSIHPNGFTQSNTVIVNEKVPKPSINSSDLEMVYKDGSAFEATFLDDGVPLKNATIQFGIVGKTYSRVTDENGTARLAINLAPGEYVITSIHPDGLKKSNNIIVKEPIISSDLVMYYRGGSFEATFLENGKPLRNASVQFGIVGKTYSKVTDENGTARLAINLAPGEYVITSIHPDGFSVSNKVTVLLRINTTDLKLYYRNGSSFKAVVTDALGEPIKNVNIQFGIVGKTYSKVTDENGTARLAINLAPGIYTINTTSPYSGSVITNKITVLSLINSEDLIMYQNNGSAFEATFLDGQGNPLTNTTVQFDLVGFKTYSRVTDENGTARLNIKLGPGEYTINSIHPNGLTASNKVTVLSRIIAKDITCYYGDKMSYSATFVDGQGNPLNNITVNFNLDGKSFKLITDDNGVATLNLGNLKYGVHSIIVSYDVYSIQKTITVNYKSTLLGSTSYGYVIRYEPIGNLSSKVVLAYSIGVHPQEYGMHQAFKERFFQRGAELHYQYVFYEIVVTKDIGNYEQGRMNGQLLARSFVLPDALNHHYKFFTDVHENWGYWASNEFVFCPATGGVGENIGRTITNKLGFCNYYYPPNPTSHVYLTLPLNNNGIPAIFFEEYTYNSYAVKCAHADAFITTVDNLKF